MALCIAFLPPEAQPERLDCSTAGHAPDLLGRLRGSGERRAAAGRPPGHGGGARRPPPADPRRRPPAGLGDGRHEGRRGAGARRHARAGGAPRALRGGRGAARQRRGVAHGPVRPHGALPRLGRLPLLRGRRDRRRRPRRGDRRAQGGRHARGRRPGPAGALRLGAPEGPQRAARAGRRWRSGSPRASDPAGPDRLTAVPTILSSGEAFNVVPPQGGWSATCAPTTWPPSSRCSRRCPTRSTGCRSSRRWCAPGPGWTRASATADLLADAAERLGRPMVASERGGASDASHIAHGRAAHDRRPGAARRRRAHARTSGSARRRCARAPRWRWRWPRRSSGVTRAVGSLSGRLGQRRRHPPPHAPVRPPPAAPGRSSFRSPAGRCRCSTRASAPEHVAVRTGAGVFDVSHMGEIETSGPDAEALPAAAALQRRDQARRARRPVLGALPRGRRRARRPVHLPPRRRPLPDRHQRLQPREGPRLVSRAAAEGFDVEVARRARRLGDARRAGPRRPAPRWRAIADGELPARMRTAELRAWRACAALVCGTGYTGEDGCELLIAPGRRRRASGTRCSSAGVQAGRAWARATRCASRSASTSTATTCPRTATRSRPASAGAASSTRASSAPTRCAASSPRRRSCRSPSPAPASRARTTRSTAPHGDGRRHQRHPVALPRDRHRDGLRAGRRRRAGHRDRGRRARQAARRRGAGASRSTRQEETSG